MNPIILFEDKHIIVCHKEAGIPVQSARLGQKDMESILNTYLMEQGEQVRVEAVHRLDQPVEGIIVFAKTKKAASELGKQLQQNSMHKIYRAVCCVEKADWNAGLEKIQTEAEEERYALTDYLLKDGRTNTSSVVKKEVKGARKAELEFCVIETVSGKAAERNECGDSGTCLPDDQKKETYMMVEIHLKTGRHHQIRVQMSHAGLPLYGDQKYHEKWKEYLTESDQTKRNTALGLCAAALEFRHPANGKHMQFKVEPRAEIFRIQNK